VAFTVVMWPRASGYVCSLDLVSWGHTCVHLLDTVSNFANNNYFYYYYT